MGTATAFFDEVEALKDELALWETTHAADFTDIIEQLDDMTGTVFTDFTGDDWYAPYVNNLAEWEIVSGYKDASGKLTGEYKPQNQVTIAETLKMALGAAQVDIVDCSEGTTSHPQAAGHWAERYVICAENLGVRMMSPVYLAALDRPAARAEVVTILHDAFQDDVLPIYSNFRDTSGHQFESDIAYAALLGVVGGDTDSNGYPLGTFRPNAAINRAEVAKVVYEKIKEQVRSDTL